MAPRNRGKKRGNKRVNNQGRKQGNKRGNDGGNPKGKDGGKTKGKDGGNPKSNVGGNEKIDSYKYLCTGCNKQWAELEPFNAHLYIRYKNGQCPVEKKK